jgi:hypothetical protein
MSTDAVRRLALVLGALASLAMGCGVTDRVPPASGSPSPATDVISFTAQNDEVTLPALDVDGAWGTITVRRGADTGGYPTNAVRPDSFVVEAHVTYVVDRDTAAKFGARDWVLVNASDRKPVGSVFVPDPTVEPWETWALHPLPGEVSADMIAVEPRTLDGWLLFEVSREVAGVPLELVYRPEGFTDAVSVLAIRGAGAAPDPVPTATADPTPAPLTYVQPSGAPFTVIEDADADQLFAEPDSCTNPSAGYTLSFPDDWYTNTAIGSTPACSWFSPTIFEVDGSEVPAEIAIVIGSFEGGIGFIHEPDYSVSDQVEIDGRNASRTEEIGGMGADGWLPRSLFTYQYTIWADDDYLGLKVIATTRNDHDGDYELNKAVLDRLMASLRFDASPPGED